MRTYNASVGLIKEARTPFVRGLRKLSSPLVAGQRTNSNRIAFLHSLNLVLTTGLTDYAFNRPDPARLEEPSSKLQLSLCEGQC